MKEYINSSTMILKETFTETIYKDIDYLLNTSGGSIVIGIKDDGTVVGVNRIEDTIRKVLDLIALYIKPKYHDAIKLEAHFREGKILIIIKTKKNIKDLSNYPAGTDYMLKIDSTLSDHTFNLLKIYAGLDSQLTDSKNFENRFKLRTKEGSFNLLAELLADSNSIPLIFKRTRKPYKTHLPVSYNYGYRCLIRTFDEIKNKLDVENICFTDTPVRPRVDTYLFDQNCVESAILITFAYNDWTKGSPRIYMYANRFEILSQGPLPNGCTVDKFLAGRAKVRNASLMHIFSSLGRTDSKDTSATLIVKKFGQSAFKFRDNLIICTIPFNQDALDKLRG